VEFPHAGVTIGDTAMPTITDENAWEFIEAYINAALFTSTDDNCEPLDAKFSIDDLPPRTIARLATDCWRFLSDVNVCADLHKAIDVTSDRGKTYSFASAGDDFWLTRNYHGAGFWSCDLYEIGDRLTANAHTYGERYLYVGDDGKVYAA
jgi:hypothetical protein